MANSKIKKVNYFTKERVDRINPDNIKEYERYIQSNTVRNADVKDTTYKVYYSYFRQFLVYLSEQWSNIGVYSDEFMDNAVDIMEGFMVFCQSVLFNHKKVINTKVSAVSSFYLWAAKRGYIKYHPFQNKLDRMKGANTEKIISSYFLTEDQVQQIRRELAVSDKYDIQDQLLFEIAYNSANRIGALDRLTLSSLNLEEMMFEGIREKEGYIVEVVFEELAKELLEEWIAMRKEDYDNLSIDAVFITKYGGEWKQTSKNTLSAHIKDYGRIIGLEDFRPHCVRKSKLNNVYEETGDLTLAADLANHKSTEVTRACYIRQKSKSEVRDRINELRKRGKEDIEE